MTIEKNGKIYTAKENKASWTVSTTIGRVDVTYNVPKADCPTFDALQAYVAASELF
ncbi:MAG: hypothetical protein NC548_44270 [Lachnospiraceae bacterium]|nr:hypothetical protein [Lachnospiraceae bacterium]